MGVSPPLNPWMWVWLIAGFAAFFGLSAYRYVRRTLRKREAFRKLAHQMGFGYFVYASDLTHAGYDLPPSLRPRKNPADPVPLGWRPGVQNILRGEKNGWTIFFLETPSQEKDGAMETRALFKNPEADLPYFELVPLRLFDKFHRLLELDIRDIVSGPGMSRMVLKGLGDFQRPRHHLWGETRQAREYENLFSKDFLECLDCQPNWRLQGRGDWVVLYEENISIPPEGLQAFADQTLKAMDLFFTGVKNSRSGVVVKAGEGLVTGGQNRDGESPIDGLRPEDGMVGRPHRVDLVGGLVSAV